jgi:hypothetical protein
MAGSALTLAVTFTDIAIDQKIGWNITVPFVAVTRLHIRSGRFLLPFGWYALRSFGQVKCAPGNLGVKLRRAEDFAFWTLTAWQNEAAMKDYRITPPHLHAMSKLLEWCDEASVVHWTQETTQFPEWSAAEKQMAESGRLSKVNHPSIDQQAGRLDFQR